MDKNNTLQVEHLLKLAHNGDMTFIEPLQVLKKTHSWHSISDNLMLDNGNRIIPFGSWADILCIYFERGVDGLIECGLYKSELSVFAIALL